MDSLTTQLWQFVYSLTDGMQHWLLTLDIGVMASIIVLTSVLKSVLARYKVAWLNDGVLTLFLFGLGIVAGIFMYDKQSTTDANLFVYAVHYAGGATLLFMLWKHVGLQVIGKLFPDSTAVKAAKGLLRSTTTLPSNLPETAAGKPEENKP
jgi:hypothetical protein